MENFMGVYGNIILNRLKQPSVVLSLVSQITTLLLLFGFQIDPQQLMTFATIVCSILVTLGIMSNPDSNHKGYGDDILICPNCNKPTLHVAVKGKMVCKTCGTEQQTP